MLQGSTRQSSGMPSILARSVSTQEEQSEEKTVKFPRPDTSQMTPFKPSAGAGKEMHFFSKLGKLLRFKQVLSLKLWDFEHLSLLKL